MVYTILPNGYVSVAAGIIPSENNIVLPRLGYSLQLPERFNQVRWFGRGPGENYPDRRAGSPMGIYTQSVGINEGAARLNGINPTKIKLISFILLGVCVSVAALIGTSRSVHISTVRGGMWKVVFNSRMAPL